MGSLSRKSKFFVTHSILRILQLFLLFTGLFKDYIKRIRKGYIGRRVIEMRVEGMRARGRPRQSWMEIVKEDLKEKKLVVMNV